MVIILSHSSNNTVKVLNDNFVLDSSMIVILKTRDYACIFDIEVNNRIGFQENQTS